MHPMTHDPTHRNIVWQRGEVSAADRARFFRQEAVAIWLQGAHPPHCRIAEVARLFNDAPMM